MGFNSGFKGLRQYLSVVSRNSMEFMGCGCTYISAEDEHVFAQAMIAVDTQCIRRGLVSEMT